MFKTTKGFTLIELLIVVAIIAILAAIAIPNFLQAQMRAKISRVKSDMRSMATGMESYQVDNNEYPADTYTRQMYYTGTGWNGGTHIQNYVPLSTPIAYMASIPKDTFPYPNTPNEYKYFHFKHWQTNYGTAVYQTDSWANEGVTQVWCIMSIGPDMNFDGADWFPVSRQYDPTNGTVSPGDVSKWGP